MADRSQIGKIVLIFVLATILVVVLLRQFHALPFGSDNNAHVGTPEATQVGQSRTSTAPGESVSSPETQAQWNRPDPIGIVARDPMRFNASTVQPAESLASPNEPSEPEFRVAGIVYNPEQPSSIIVDGQILHEGNTIHGATVVEITEEYAVLQRGDKTWTIRAGQTNKEPE